MISLHHSILVFQQISLSEKMHIYDKYFVNHDTVVVSVHHPGDGNDVALENVVFFPVWTVKTSNLMFDFIPVNIQRPPDSPISF